MRGHSVALAWARVEIGGVMLKEFGIITPTDAQSLAEALDYVIEHRRSPLRVCEIGICHGGTSRGIARYLNDRGIPFEYWGVDNDRDGRSGGAVCAKAPPFPGANVVQGESEFVYMRVPGDIDFLFVDGGHDIQHVMLDALHYGDKVVKGGVMVFHDIAPRGQNKLDYQGIGPEDHPDFGTATVEALRKLGMHPMRRDDWKLLSWKFDDAADWGGIAVFEKL